MEIIKTICPRCFKIFNVPSDDGIDKVRCNFCEYMYDLPRFEQRDNLDGGDYLSKYYLRY